MRAYGFRRAFSAEGDGQGVAGLIMVVNLLRHGEGCGGGGGRKRAGSACCGSCRLLLFFLIKLV